MITSLLGIKKHMTSTYDARGRRVGATVVEVSPNFVTQVKLEDGKDGYNAVQLGFGTKKSVNKPQVGHAKKAGFDQKMRWFKEVKIQTQSGSRKLQHIAQPSLENIEPGQQINVSQVFSIGDAVKVSAKSKGRGFAGVIKRHGFHGGPKTHGQSDRHRAPGSIGSGTTPGRVLKGKKMAGHMGNEQVSVRNLEIVAIDKPNNLLVIKGGIPGPVGSLITVTKLGRIKGYTPPPEEKVEEEGEESGEGKVQSEKSEQNESAGGEENAS